MIIKIHVNKTTSLIIKIMLLCLVIALYGYCSILRGIKQFIPLIQMLLVGALCLQCINLAIKKKLLLDNSDFIAIGLIAYLNITLIWAEDINTYNFITKIFFVISAFIMYYVVKHYAKQNDISLIYKVLVISLFIDLICVAYQVFICRINSDFSNGIFGIDSYYNGVQGVFCILCCILALYLQTIEVKPMKEVAIIILVSSLICAISEIKTFFFLLIFLFVMYFLLWFKIDVKKLLMFVGLVFAMFVAFRILGKLYGQNTVVFKSVDNLIKYIGYSNGHDQSATRVGGIISFFDNEKKIILLGKGFGSNITYSDYGFADFLNQSGILGVTLFCLFYLTNILNSLKRGKMVELRYNIIFSMISVVSMIVWAGLFGNIVSFFSLIFLGIVNKYRNEEE